MIAASTRQPRLEDEIACYARDSEHNRWWLRGPTVLHIVPTPVATGADTTVWLMEAATGHGDTR
jgi:hypothetical protein